MNRGLFTIVIEDASSKSYRQAMKVMESFTGDARKKLDRNGTRTIAFSHDVSDPSELAKHIGKIALLAQAKGLQPYRKPKGFWSTLIDKAGKEARSLIEDEIEL